tara:strand:+ start:45 stop:647 length:603 start_codon:yes stop_codon:yes gene_type:complete
MDKSKIFSLAARYYLNNRDSDTGGIKFAPTGNKRSFGDIAKGAAKNLATTKLTTSLMGKLGLGSLLGPLGFLVAPFLSKMIGGGVNKLTGGGGWFGRGRPKLTQKEIWEKDDVDLADQGFTATGTYGGNDVYSAEGTTVDKDGSLTSNTGQHIGNINDEFGFSGDTNSSGSTGSMSASDFSDDTAGTPFRKGGLASLWQR